MKKTTLTPFEQALLDVNMEEFMDVPAEQDIDMEFSPAFQVKSQELIRKAEHSHWSSEKVFLRKVALVALIAGLLALTACAIPLIWDSIIDFFVKDTGTHYEFYFDPDDVANAPRQIETVYFPTYIPDDFEEESYYCSIAAVSGLWYSENGKQIYYVQGLIPPDPLSGQSGHINSEGAESNWISINNCQVLRIESSEWISYAWVTSEYEFSIMCQKPIEEDELIRIFDSIRIDCILRRRTAADALVSGRPADLNGRPD